MGIFDTIKIKIKDITDKNSKSELDNKSIAESLYEEEFDPNKIIIKSTDELKYKQYEQIEDKEETSVKIEPLISINSNYQLPNLDDYITDTKVKKALNDSIEIEIPFYNGSEVDLVKLSDLSNLFVYGIQESGKSSLIHSIIDTILITQKPDKVKMIIIDTKKLEHSNYNGVPHLLCPVVTDPKKASIALQNVVREIEHRYDMFNDERVKNIKEYNEYINLHKIKNPDDETIQFMPNILLIVDELNDLTIIDKDITYTIEQIAKNAKTVGISLICVSSNIVQPAFNNILFSVLQSRLMFRAYNQIDYKRILGNNLKRELDDYEFYLKNYNLRLNNYYKYYRYPSTIEENIIRYVDKQQSALYEENIMMASSSSSDSDVNSLDYEDPLMNEVIDFAVESGKISASLIQRRFRLGYNRAAKLVDELEARGIIGPQIGSKPREVLVKIQGDE